MQGNGPQAKYTLREMARVFGDRGGPTPVASDDSRICSSVYPTHQDRDNR